MGIGRRVSLLTITPIKANMIAGIGSQSGLKALVEKLSLLTESR